MKKYVDADACPVVGTVENIDQMIMERHLAKKARRSNKKNHMKGSSKRTAEDDQRFAESFEKMVRNANFILQV